MRTRFAPPPFHRWSLRILVLPCALSVLGPGCGQGGVALFVDVRTDLVAGLEFSSLEAVVDDSAIERVEVAAGVSNDFRSGMRLAEWSELESNGARQLVVRALDAVDSVVVERTVRVDHRSDQVVTVVLTRDCREQACDPELSCLGGACVTGECFSGAEPACEGAAEPECSENADCPNGARCATARCEAGICLLYGDDLQCETDEQCSPVSGCVPRAADFPTAALVSYTDCSEGTGDGFFDNVGRSWRCVDPGSCPTTERVEGRTGCYFDGRTALTMTSTAAFETPGSFTIALWVRAEAASGAMLSKPYGSEFDNSWQLEYQVWNDGDLSFTTSDTELQFLRYPLSDFVAWHHVVGVYDEGVRRLYVDGEEVATDTQGATPFDGSDLYLGADSNEGNLSGYFAGWIDDVYIFDRALDPTEILRVRDR